MYIVHRHLINIRQMFNIAIGAITAKPIFISMNLLQMPCVITNNKKNRLLTSQKKNEAVLNKVHIFSAGHEILRNLHLTFVLCSASQKLGKDLAKFCGLLRIYELYLKLKNSLIFL